MDIFSDQSPHNGGRTAGFDHRLPSRHLVFSDHDYNYCRPPAFVPPPSPSAFVPPLHQRVNIPNDGSCPDFSCHQVDGGFSIHDRPPSSHDRFHPLVSCDPEPYRDAFHQGSRNHLPALQTDRREFVERFRVSYENLGWSGFDGEREVRRFHAMPSRSYPEMPYSPDDMIMLEQKGIYRDQDCLFEEVRGSARSLQCVGFAGGPVAHPFYQRGAHDDSCSDFAVSHRVGQPLEGSGSSFESWNRDVVNFRHGEESGFRDRRGEEAVEQSRFGILPMDSQDFRVSKRDDVGFPIIGRHQPMSSTIEEGTVKQSGPILSDFGHGFKEQRFLGACKNNRRMGGGCKYSQNLMKNRSKRASPWKASALSRIKSGLSVWDRLERKKPRKSLRTSFPSFDTSLPIDKNEPQVDEGLNLAFKSDGLVAEVSKPISSTIGSSEKKGRLLKGAEDSSKKKKKIVKTREKIVVPIMPNLSDSGGSKVVSKLLGCSLDTSCKSTCSPVSAKVTPNEVMSSPSSQVKSHTENLSNICEKISSSDSVVIEVDKNTKDSTVGLVRVEDNLENSMCVEENRIPVMTENNCTNSLIRGVAISEVEGRAVSPRMPLENGVVEMLSMIDFATHNPCCNGNIHPKLAEDGNQAYFGDDFSSTIRNISQASSLNDFSRVEIDDRREDIQQNLEFRMGKEELMNASESKSICFDLLDNTNPVNGEVQEVVTQKTERAVSGGSNFHDGYELLQRDSFLTQENSIPNLLDSVDEMDYMLVESNGQNETRLMEAGSSYSGLFKGFCKGHEALQNEVDEAPASKSLVLDAEVDVVSEKIVQNHYPIGKENLLGQPQSHILSEEKLPIGLELRKDGSKVASAIRVVNGQPKLSGPSRQTSYTSQNMKRKTWHRNGNTSTSASHGNLQWANASLQKHPVKKIEGLKCSSYVRKGNSLIRKPHVESPYSGLSIGVGEQKGNFNRATEIETQSRHLASCSNFSFERTKSPPLSQSTESLQFGVSLLHSDPHSEDTISGDQKFDLKLKPEAQVLKLEDQNVDTSSRRLGVQSITKCQSALTDPKKTVYVKKKSNQLVASIVHEQKSSEKVPFGLYHRKRKNQIVRNASSDGTHGKNLATSPVVSDSDVPRKKPTKVGQVKRASKDKFSHVWTLNKEADQTSARKVMRGFFPWWKSTMIKFIPSLYWRSFYCWKTQNRRKRAMISAMPMNRARVTNNVGGSLKWSKSNQILSKKENEKHVPVVSLALKARGKWKLVSSDTGAKHGSSKKRERIFRVGSSRYKMDTSQRTLVRVPDEQSLCLNDRETTSIIDKSLVPRRLTIGNDEYVRVGNGNQLVRNPKKLIRILASQKVRWSLHTARLRLAKKQQYCQFFTRFGKCNKSDGKCPYIHDSTKIAVCTKFLRGVCSNSNCKLTHKVLPERMPDCSYFLQGTCTNTSCPYRHVNVNRNAPVCDGFLRGYCADGDECCKKHSYICPVFEATGECKQGSQCKLHHPKIATNNPKKRKHTKLLENGNRRYFNPHVSEVGETHSRLSTKKAFEEDGDLLYHDGRFAEFISLNVSGDGDEPPVFESDLESKAEDDPNELDMCIKPVRIMMASI